jgi:Predicted ATPase of the ABC class.
LDILKKRLESINHKGYKAYKSIEGMYQFPPYRLSIDHVQGDPFAEPSKVRILIRRKETSISDPWIATKFRRIACEDLLARRVHRAIRSLNERVRGSGKSGLIAIDAPGQKVLERTAVQISDQTVTLCLSIGLPAAGRTILAGEAKDIFFKQLPKIVEEGIFGINESDLASVAYLADQQEAIRQYLRENGYVAFVANGSILPRESGISDRPLTSGAIPFQSPPELEISIPIPHRDEPITGMGIKEGITLIVGGGYHGKSTLLKALEQGVYNHMAGDGREYVITDERAVKIRAEDGRYIADVDISPFIGTLPYGKDTTRFSTDNASGSTSQAANLMEMLEAGAKAFLIDEDTSATNLLIRDARMQALVAKKSEPITPYIDRAKTLYEWFGVSSILVVGGLGDYFDIADCVIKMDRYIPSDVTKEAKQIVKEMPSRRKVEIVTDFRQVRERIPIPQSLDSQRGKRAKATARSLSVITYGQTDISLHAVEQLVDPSQTRAICAALFFMEQEGWLKQGKTIRELLDAIEFLWNEKGLAAISFRKGHPGEMARPRRFELAAALNRLRTLRCRQRIEQLENV